MRSGRIGILLSALLIVLSLGALLGCQKKPTAKQTEVLAQVGKEVLTMEDFEQLIPPEYRTALGQPEKENLVNSWVNAELFYQAGLKKGLDKEKDIARKLKDTERQIIANEMLQREIGGKIQVSDQEARKYYDSHLAEFGEEVHIRQILVPTEDQAKAILDTLAKGAEFTKLAQERSMDPSGQGGGDVGFISRGTGVLPLEFEEAAFSLSKGQTSGVVRTNFGFHILQGVEKRPLKQTTPFDQVKSQLASSLTARKQKEAFDQTLEALKKETPVVMHLELLK